MTRFSAALTLALVFLLLHLPYLPASLEDVDSINFALGVRQFDVAHHQPHPPGYPVFIAAAKFVNRFIRDEARALGLLSVLAGTLGVLAVAALFRRVRASERPAWEVIATALAIASPLYWFTAVRPLSDVTGLVAAVAVQAATLSAQTPLAWYLASFCAGFTTGVRSQAVWLTVPLLVVRAAQLGKGSMKAVWPGAAAFTGGVLLWLIPLSALTGGPAAYWRALFGQGAEDLSGVRMLWTTPTPRQLVDGLYYAFVGPWALWQVAVIVLVLATLGAATLARRQRDSLCLVLIAFGPYLVFDLVFQETITGRYALPLVVPVAYLAAEGLLILPRVPSVALAAAIVMFNAHIGGISIAAYSRQRAPAFRLLADMAKRQANAAERAEMSPVAAMDRREELDLRRPFAWVGDAGPKFDRRLPAPPQHEWLELARFWNSHGPAPVWFVADPLRADIHLMQHDEPQEYRWSLPYPVLVSGIRPNQMDWYRLTRPEWYVGEGWALTPEAAGVAEAEHRGLSFGPIHASVRTDVLSGGMLVLGGRNFDPTIRPRLTLSRRIGPAERGDGAPAQQDRGVGASGVIMRTIVRPGSFVEVLRLPFIQFDASVPEYGRLIVEATPGARVTIEQFDVSAVRPVSGFGDGWYEPEYNPATGRRWRWLSNRAELLTGHPVGLEPPRPLILRLEGESPLKYFSRGSRLVIRAGEQVAFDAVLSSDFSLSVPILKPTEIITLETDQTYIPAERRWGRSKDRRRLGLRIFKCELRRPRS